MYTVDMEARSHAPHFLLLNSFLLGGCQGLGPVTNRLGGEGLPERPPFDGRHRRGMGLDPVLQARLVRFRRYGIP